jgi:hypothetical protein
MIRQIKNYTDAFLEFKLVEEPEAPINPLN